MLEYRDVYAGGRLLPSASLEAVTVANPATEEIVGAAPAAVPQDVDTAVRAARLAFDTGPWPRVDQAERAAAMDRLAMALEARAQDTARLVTAEMGMPINVSRVHNAEVPVTILRYYAALARALQPEEIRAAVNFRGHTMIRREPVGVSAVVAPWNYPLAIAFSQLAPALAAGCTVVLKPAMQTSLSAYILAEAFEAADFPPGVFNLVTGRHEVAEMLARHPGVDKVAFAGPASIGRRIAAACGETLKSVNLELGGKCAAIVLQDADLGAACTALGLLAFANAGQTCFAASRVLVPRSRYEEALAGLAGEATASVIGDPMSADTTMGPLVSPDHRAGVESYVAAATAGGAQVLSGGRRPAAPVRGYYYEPTVLAGAAGAEITTREVFGPVVTVIPYARECEVVAIANDWGCGLAGSVWTSDRGHGLDIARRIHAGTFGVNLYVPDLGSPWGHQASGQGSTYGPECLAAYLKPRSVFLPEPAPPMIGPAPQPRPAWLRSAPALSVRSQVNSGSARPK
ncbi:MAG TPA: aldehyde dehydrogenase family protein [Streptosporangiaceae bacterium]|nr:aldehyde dehydrogenase family protein [Streptosporangiaceae bacterium]